MTRLRGMSSTGAPETEKTSSTPRLGESHLSDTLNIAPNASRPKADVAISIESLLYGDVAEDFDHESLGIGIIFPYKSSWEYWNRFLLLCIVLTCLVEPFNAAFQKSAFVLMPDSHVPQLSFTIGYILDFIYALHIFFKFRVSYQRGISWVIDAHLIALRYFWDDFLLDLVTVLPLDVFALAWPTPMEQAVAQSVLRLNRVVRAVQLYRYLTADDHSHNVEDLMKYSQYTSLIVIIGHWLACGWYAISCIDGCATPEEIALSWASTSPLDFRNLSILSRYIISFYWAVYSTTSVGYGHVYPVNSAERIFCVCAILLGNLMYSFVTGSITSMLVNKRAKKLRFQQKVEAVKKFMKQRQMEFDMQDRVLDSYEYAWIKNQGTNVAGLIEDMPHAFKAEISVAINEKILTKVPLFHDTPITFIRTVACALNPLILLPGDYAVHKGDMGQEMFFVAHGSVDVVSEDGKQVFATMNDGAFFGELALLNRMARTASIRASCHTDLYYLRKEDLDEILNYFPQVAEQINREAEERLKLVAARSKK